MTSFVQAERNENDPCLALKCDKNSYCVIIPESQTAHCECNQGYFGEFLGGKYPSFTSFYVVVIESSSLFVTSYTHNMFLTI